MWQTSLMCWKLLVRASRVCRVCLWLVASKRYVLFGVTFILVGDTSQQSHERRKPGFQTGNQWTFDNVTFSCTSTSTNHHVEPSCYYPQRVIKSRKKGHTSTNDCQHVQTASARFLSHVCTSSGLGVLRLRLTLKAKWELQRLDRLANGYWLDKKEIST